MKLTKDEARILASAIRDFKYRIYDGCFLEGLAENLDQLEVKLENFGKDARRNGRTSFDDWNDLLKRFAKPKNK